MHERHAQHGGLGAGDAAGLAQQHVGRVHIGRHLIRERHGQHALPMISVLERLPQRLVPAGQHAQQCVFIRHAADRIAQRHGVAAADAAGHDEIDLLVRRQPQRCARGGFVHRREKARRHRHAGHDELFGRHPGLNAQLPHLAVRQKVSVEVGLGKKRDARIVREDAVAFHVAALPPAQERECFHWEQVRADNGVIAVVADEGVELPRMADVGHVDRRGDAGRAVHRTCVVHHAEHVRRLGRDAVEDFVKAQRPGVAEHVQHIEEGCLVSARVERLLDGERAVVVPLAGAAAQKQDFHTVASCVFRSVLAVSGRRGRDHLRKCPEQRRRVACRSRFS